MFAKSKYQKYLQKSFDKTRNAIYAVKYVDIIPNLIMGYTTKSGIFCYNYTCFLILYYSMSFFPSLGTGIFFFQLLSVCSYSVKWMAKTQYEQ